MPIAAGIRGGRNNSIFAMPSAAGQAGVRSVRSVPFRSQPFDATARYITGVTKDSADAILANCVVQLFRTSDDVLIEEKTSDGAGAFTFYPGAFYCYVVAYKAGSPDVAGTTINTLLATA